jgi:hypothetical protein
MFWRPATSHRYGESFFMRGLQRYPFFFEEVGTDKGFSIDNCLQGHKDPLYFLSTESCMEFPNPESHPVYANRRTQKSPR